MIINGNLMQTEKDEKTDLHNMVLGGYLPAEEGQIVIVLEFF